MRIPGRAALTACSLALAAVLLAGCTPAHSVTDPTETPKPTPTPVFTSDADALAAATATYKKFEQVTDQIGRDGGAHPERVKPLVNASGYEFELEAAQKMQAEHSHGVGSTVLNSVVLQSHEEKSGVATVTIYTCEDISAVDRIGADGKSLIGSDRADLIAYEAVLTGHSPDTLVIQSNKYWSGGGVCKQ